MLFDVMIHDGYNANGKQIVNVYKVHESRLSQTLRDYQNANKYIIAVTPLKDEEKKEVDEEKLIYEDRLDSICIDPHGF